MGIRGSDLRERMHQAAHGLGVLFEGLAARDAQRVFEERIDVDRHVEARGGFEVVMPPTFFADSLRRAVAAHGPIESALSCAREIEALDVIRTKNKTEFSFAAHDSVSDAVH